MLSYDKVKIIAWMLRGLDKELLTRIEEEAVHAARFTGPRALRRTIEKLICNANPDEAARARHEATTTRKLTITPECHGMAQLYARPTATEAKVALHRLQEVASTACPDDRRKPEALLVEALMALLNGETQIACGCAHQDRCPMRHYTTPEHTKVITHVHVHPETLLGLFAITAMALAASMGLPPPRATTMSLLLSLYARRPSSTILSVGSVFTWS